MKLRNVLNCVLRVLAGGSMAVMVLLVCWQVITRYFLNNPSTWSEELVGYLFAWATLFGAAIVSGERGHMNIPIVIDKFGPRAKKAFLIFSEVVAFLFSASILIYGGIQITGLAMGQATSSLGVQVGVFYVVMPICGVLIALYAVLNIIDIARGKLQSGADDEAAAAIAKVKAEDKSVKEG